MGGTIRWIQIVHFDNPIDSLERAGALTRELLASIVVSPEHCGAPFCDLPLWSEPTWVTIRALIQFEDGRIGRMECDATDDGSQKAGGVHLFLEDYHGTYWWHRWDAYFPRKVLETTSANESAEGIDNPVDGSSTP
jgi:hypothetical protein